MSLKAIVSNIVKITHISTVFYKKKYQASILVKIIESVFGVLYTRTEVLLRFIY